MTTERTTKSTCAKRSRAVAARRLPRVGRATGLLLLRSGRLDKQRGGLDFVVSRDGETWFPMFQEHGPRGYVRTVDETQPILGSAERAIRYLEGLNSTLEKIMREIRVLVTVQVDECDPDAKIDRETMEDAAADAIENAVRAAESMGFTFPQADDLSIGFVDAVVYEEPGDDE